MSRHADFRKRLDEFPPPIHRISINDTTVRIVMERYACGEIVTYQEALYQMILQLSINTRAAHEDVMALRQILG
jgi:hypothetical protein